MDFWARGPGEPEEAYGHEKSAEEGGVKSVFWSDLFGAGWGFSTRLRSLSYCCVVLSHGGMMMWQVESLVHVCDGWNGKENTDDDGAEYEAVLFGGKAISHGKCVGEGGKEGEEDTEAGLMLV